MKMTLICMKMKLRWRTHFHTKGFARKLVLQQRPIGSSCHAWCQWTVCVLRMLSSDRCAWTSFFSHRSRKQFNRSVLLAKNWPFRARSLTIKNIVRLCWPFVDCRRSSIYMLCVFQFRSIDYLKIFCSAAACPSDQKYSYCGNTSLTCPQTCGDELNPESCLR